jgi:hypothetical protein
MKKPSQCLEYILVHELVHLLERHHNDRFIGLMDKFLSYWRTLRSQLNKAPLAHSDWKYSECPLVSALGGIEPKHQVLKIKIFLETFTSVNCPLFPLGLTFELACFSENQG